MKKDGEVIDQFGVVTDAEARQLVASMCGVDEMLVLRALAGSIPGVPSPKRLSDKAQVFDRSELVSWANRNKAKLAEAAKPQIHKDSVSTLRHAAKLSDADYAVSFDNAGTYQGHSASEKL